MVHVAAWQVTDTTGNHNKYYRAYVAGARVVFQYGRIGTIQSTQVTDAAHPLAAIQAATRKIESKLNDRSKNYVVDGATLLLDVPADMWTGARAAGHELNMCYRQSEYHQRHLAGSLTDKRPHVVALAGGGKRNPSDRIGANARAHATHPHLDVTVAVLNATQAAAADRTTNPRVALLDLGIAESTDDQNVLEAALRLWTPETGSAPQAHLQVCLENARMIFAESAS